MDGWVNGGRAGAGGRDRAASARHLSAAAWCPNVTPETASRPGGGSVHFHQATLTFRSCRCCCSQVLFAVSNNKKSCRLAFNVALILFTLTVILISRFYYDVNYCLKRWEGANCSFHDVCSALGVKVRLRLPQSESSLSHASFFALKNKDLNQMDYEVYLYPETMLGIYFATTQIFNTLFVKRDWSIQASHTWMNLMVWASLSKQLGNRKRLKECKRTWFSLIWFP